MSKDIAKRSQPSIDKLAVHTMTTKPMKLEVAVREYAARGIRGISVWKEALEGYTTSEAKQIIVDHGLEVPALVRGGFFCAESKSERLDKIEENRRLIETAAEIEAEMLVLVVGAIPTASLETQRQWVSEGIAALIDEAKAANIHLAIEPLHPMYAGDKSCINRIAEASEICEQLGCPNVGVAVDVYHVWWDPELTQQIELLGKTKRLFAFHICDWRVPTRHLLTDRTLMGQGCIDVPGIRACVEQAGFDGWNEVEIFSEDFWAQDQGEFLDQIVSAYQSDS
ncbi:MAG: sugar phosphate isomerase/epimerase family protein [Planctomycetota bacterium]